MNSKLKRMVLVTSALMMCVAAGNASAGLIAHWGLDEVFGNWASDYSENAHVGTLLGGFSFDRDLAAGAIGSALHFDGKDDCINASSVQVPTDAFTVALWFNPDSTLDAGSGRMDFVYWGKGKGRGPCLIFNRKGRGEIGLYGEARKEYDHLLTTTNSWPASRWYHIVVTFEPTCLRLYVNGNLEDLVEDSDMSSHSHAADVYFGIGAQGKYAFAGKLDEIRIYNHALTAEEVVQLQKPTLLSKEPVDAVAEAWGLVRKNPKDAIVFIERKIAEHEQRDKEHQGKYGPVYQKVHFDLYFLLAKAKEAAGAPKKDIADAHSRLFDFTNSRFRGQLTESLIWLLDNECTNECRQIIKSYTRKSEANELLRSIISNVWKDCESTSDWPRLKQLLDALFAEAKPPYQWSVFVESCFDNKTTSLAKKYHDYLDNNHAYKLDRDHTFAEGCVADRKYEEAVRLYLRILDRCGPADDRVLFEFELYQCMFLNGQYRDVIPKLEAYIAASKAANQARIDEARLMKARAHAKLGQIEQAIQDCSAVIQNSGASQAPEGTLFMGYFLMQQGKPKEAREVFEGVVRDYPESSWANKARLCLDRLKDVADGGTAKRE